MRTRYSKLLQEKAKSGSAPKRLSDRDTWILENFGFLREHLVLHPTRTSRVNIKTIVLAIPIIHTETNKYANTHTHTHTHTERLYIYTLKVVLICYVFSV